MRLFLLLLLSTSTLICKAQNVKVLRMNPDFERHAYMGGFNYLHEDLPPEDYVWIADVKVDFDSILPNTLESLYVKLSQKGSKIGANAFRVLNADIYAKGGHKYIEMGVYYLYRERKSKNRDLFRRSQVYLFGFLGHHQSIEGYTVRANGEKIVLREQRYKEWNLKEDGDLTVQLGKRMKSTRLLLKAKKNELPNYLCFNMYRGLFSRPRITEYDWSFGEFLLRLLKREQLVLETAVK